MKVYFLLRVDGSRKSQERCITLFTRFQQRETLPRRNKTHKLTGWLTDWRKIEVFNVIFILLGFGVAIFKTWCLLHYSIYGNMWNDDARVAKSLSISQKELEEIIKQVSNPKVVKGKLCKLSGVWFNLINFSHSYPNGFRWVKKIARNVGSRNMIVKNPPNRFINHIFVEFVLATTFLEGFNIFQINQNWQWHIFIDISPHQTMFPLGVNPPKLWRRLLKIAKKNWTAAGEGNVPRRQQQLTNSIKCLHKFFIAFLGKFFLPVASFDTKMLLRFFFFAWRDFPFLMGERPLSCDDLSGRFLSVRKQYFSVTFTMKMSTLNRHYRNGKEKGWKCFMV